jgi:hypothetical protein
MKNKKGIELGINTIVILVLLMSVLILGLVLIRSIFTSAIHNVETIDNKVRDEINKLFVEDKRTVVYLANQEAKIKQGNSWGVAFGLTNLKSGTSESERFTYIVKASDPDIKRKCGITEKEAESWITTGRTDTISIGPGNFYYGLVRFAIPETSPLCTIRFHLETKVEGEIYDTNFFDITTKG